MGFLNNIKNHDLNRKSAQSGNVFLALFGAVALIGVLGAASMTILKGPVRTMAEVTQRTVAENNMIAIGQLALRLAATQADGGDCDTDGTVEPIPFGSAVPGFTGGGAVPATIGASRQDPWGRDYVYCVWDHGTDIDAAGCGGATQNRLTGSTSTDNIVIAVISGGRDGTYNTSCVDFTAPGTPLVARTAGSDDIILEYTYAEAAALAGGVWNIKIGEPDVAEIQKDLEVTNATNDVVFGVDTAGPTPSIQVDYIRELTANNDVQFLNPVTVSGQAGIGGTDRDGTLTITGAPDISAVNGPGQGGLVIQDSDIDTSGRRLRVDANEIQASNNGTAANLLINPFGGSILFNSNVRFDSVPGAAPGTK